MDKEAGNHIGHGLAWMGFWLMIGLANFGEEPVSALCEKAAKTIAGVADMEKGND